MSVCTTIIDLIYCCEFFLRIDFKSRPGQCSLTGALVACLKIDGQCSTAWSRHTLNFNQYQHRADSYHDQVSAINPLYKICSWQIPNWYSQYSFATSVLSRKQTCFVNIFQIILVHATLTSGDPWWADDELARTFLRTFMSKPAPPFIFMSKPAWLKSKPKPRLHLCRANSQLAWAKAPRYLEGAQPEFQLAAK